MPKFAVATSLFEPIEVEVLGVVHTVVFDEAMWEKVVALSEENEKTPLPQSEFVRRELAIFLGEDVIKDWPLLVRMRVNNFISSNTVAKINGDLGPEKNA
jgi:hypothetical protein